MSTRRISVYSLARTLLMTLVAGLALDVVGGSGGLRGMGTDAAAIVVPTPTAAITNPTPTTSPTPGCGALPLVGCRTPTVGRKSLLSIKNHELDEKDKLLWKWLKGSETVVDDFGNPIVQTHYDFCIYDGTSNLILAARAPRSGACTGRPCWKKTLHGFQYSDPLLTPDGLRKIVLKEGEAEKARIILKAKGENLGLPAQPLLAPLRVQLRNTAGFCWEAVYSEPLKNTAEVFRSRAD